MTRTVFTDALLFDGLSAPRASQSIAVEGDEIVAIADTLPPRPDDEVIDLAGRTLMPGLTTCHFHSTYRDIGTHAVPLGIEAPPVYLGLVAAEHLKRALDAGFTGVVSGGAIAANIDAQCKMAIEDGLIPGPRLLPGSRGLDTVAAPTDIDPWWWDLGNSGAALLASGADGFRDAVRGEVKRGAEMIKLFVTAGHAGFPGRPGTDGLMTFGEDELRSAVDTAHSLGVRVRAHCVWKSAIRSCIEAGVDVIDHGDQLDQEIIDLMVEHGTFLVPSMFFVHRLLTGDGGFLDSTDSLAEARRDYENMLEWLPRANAAGVRILCGDDYGVVTLPHGLYAEELPFYAKQVGIPPLDILRWATVNGAELLGLGDRGGRIEVGAHADLIVLEGDPTIDLSLFEADSNPIAVMKAGVFYRNDL